MISTTPTLTGKLTTALMFVYYRNDVLPAVQRYILKTGFKTAIKAMLPFLPSISACEEWLPIRGSAFMSIEQTTNTNKR